MTTSQDIAPAKQRAIIAEDYRYSQQVAVVIRWFVLAAWLFLVNYRTDLEPPVQFALDTLAIPLILANAYVHWRIRAGRPVTSAYVYALSILDVMVVLVGLAMTTRFANTFFVFFYPVLIGFSVVFHQRRVALGLGTLAIGGYIAISVLLEPGVSIADQEERILAARVVSMFAVVVAANLMTRIERNRRIAAVEAERLATEENASLEQKALRAEVALVEERSRIAREIHDGIAQEVYMLEMGIETCLALAKTRPEDMERRLNDLLPLARQTLLHTRNYLYDLKPLLEGRQGLVEMAENQVREFETITAIPADIAVEGEVRGIPVEASTALYRTIQEGLANVFKHAKATRASVRIVFREGSVGVTIEDDGVGFDTSARARGHGLANMRSRAEELGGTVTMTARNGQGTRVETTVPV